MKKKLLVLAISAASMVAGNVATAAETMIKVTLLGTGVPLLHSEHLEENGRALSGLLVEAGSERMLFDVGQGVYNRLLESGGSFLNPNVGVDKVFLSHLHSDHIADLAPLYSIGGLYRHPDATLEQWQGTPDIYPFPTQTPLRVWGPGASRNQPVGTWSMMQSFRNAYEADFKIRNLWDGWDGSVGYGAVETLNSTKEIMPGVIYKNNGVKVTAFTVNHKPVSPSYGFRVDYKGRSFVYSGDTAYSKALVKNAKDVDLLVHEVYGYARDVAPNIYDYHTSPETAAKIFNETKPTMAAFTHLVVPPNTTPNDLVERTKAGDPDNGIEGYKGDLVAGVDLMIFNIKDTGVVRVKAPANAKKQNNRKSKSHFVEVVRQHNH